MMKIKRILCCAVFAVCVPLAHAQSNAPKGAPAGADPSSLTEAQIKQAEVPTALYRLAAIYKQQGDLQRLVWALQQLNTLMPNTGELKLALASVYAERGEKSKTYDVLLHMQQQGFGYDLTDNKSFAKVSDTKVWTYIVENLKANLKPFGEGKVAFTLPKGDYLFESLAYDAKRKQFLAGSVREGKIYRVGKDGKLQDFIVPGADNGLWGVYAMAVDADRDALYVASTASVYFKGFKQEDFGKAGVFKFKLSTGKLQSKYLLAPDNQTRTLSSIAIGKDGQVFAADGLRNIIYRLDGDTLKMMVENPKLTSIRGLAVSGDGKRLYFADYALGVFGVDLAAGKGFDLDYKADELVLGGIDGLYWYDNTLVVIENGMSPKRVMRLQLGADGRKIEKIMPLDVANAAFALPTYGTINADGLYFIANSQKNGYDTYGVPKDAAKLEAVHVFRSDLRFAWNESGVGPQVKSIPASAPAPAVPRSSGLFDNVEGGAQSSQDAGSGG
jgi:sugar lactone lactonase YvrE